MIEQFGILKNDQTCFLNFQPIFSKIYRNLGGYIHFQIIVMILKSFIKNSFVFSKTINMQLEKIALCEDLYIKAEKIYISQFITGLQMDNLTKHTYWVI